MTYLQDFKKVEKNIPEISVILPVYNGMKYLSDAINSILASIYKNIELIIVNDGSTDSTEEYVLSLKDNRIRYFKQENQKLPSALNKGISMCRGKYITWASHDNTYHEDALYKMKIALDLYPECDYVYAGHKIFGDYNYNVSGTIVTNREFLFNFRGVCCFLWRKKVTKDVGLFDKDIFGAEDWDYWLRIFENNNKIVSIKKILYNYRTHSDSTSNKIANNYLNIETILAKKLLQRQNGLIDPHLYYPSLKMCCDIQRSTCIAYYDLGVSILQTQKRFLKTVFSQNIERYFEKSYHYDQSFTPSLYNLIISLHKKELDIDKYIIEFNNHHEHNIYNLVIEQNIENLNYFLYNSYQEEIFVKERIFLKDYQIEDII